MALPFISAYATTAASNTDDFKYTDNGTGPATYPSTTYPSYSIPSTAMDLQSTQIYELQRRIALLEQELYLFKRMMVSQDYLRKPDKATKEKKREKKLGTREIEL